MRLTLAAAAGLLLAGLPARAAGVAKIARELLTAPGDAQVHVAPLARALEAGAVPDSELRDISAALNHHGLLRSIEARSSRLASEPVPLSLAIQVVATNALAGLPRVEAAGWRSELRALADAIRDHVAPDDVPALERAEDALTRAAAQVEAVAGETLASGEFAERLLSEPAAERRVRVEHLPTRVRVMAEQVHRLLDDLRREDRHGTEDRAEVEALERLAELYALDGDSWAREALLGLSEDPYASRMIARALLPWPMDPAQARRAAMLLVESAPTFHDAELALGVVINDGGADPDLARAARLALRRVREARSALDPRDG